jgi:AcrR family transcriptional regulator
VIAAAASVLSELGVVGFTTKAVARRAGVAESSIFYHFSDRAGLLQEIIFAEVGGYHAMAQELITDDVPPSTGIPRLLEFLEDYYLRILPGMSAMQADPQTLADFRGHGQRYDLGPHRAVGPVQSYLEGQQRAGRVAADADLPSIALFIVGSAFQRALARRFGSPRSLPSGPQISDQLLRLLTD